MFDSLPQLINFDVSIDIDHMDDFCSQLTDETDNVFPSAKIYIFGHIADGNLHIAVDIPNKNGSTEQQLENFLYGLIYKFNGSVSAEHGIGLKKRPYLNCSRSPDEIQTMQLLKSALDPKGILNPGKVL